MSLNQNVRAAILRVSDVSKSARVIAQRLGFVEGQSVSAAEVTDVEAMKQEIEALHMKLAELRLLISSSHTEDGGKDDLLTEGQRQEFIEQFRSSLGTQPFSVISSVYDREYFEDFSRITRHELCTELVNWCQERKFTPLELWYSVMVNNGTM